MAPTILSLVTRHTPDSRDEHEAAFMARYATVRACAARLAGADTHLLEDLVQDAYVLFTTARPDLSQIRNLDAYLATLVRNLHVSTVRRAVAHRMRHVAVEDYDSATLALGASSAEDHLEARDAVRRICQFACTRKETSRAASAFVLRFFQDCYPSDIARILRTTPATVHTWLSQARREARQHLTALPAGAAPDALEPLPGSLLAGSMSDHADALAVLRAAISATAQPPCLTAEAVRRWRRPECDTPLDVATCAHIASCPHCLDRICTELEVSSDPGSAPPDGTGGGSTGGASTGHGRTFHEHARRRARGLREHRPQLLEISINGHHVGALRVASSRNELSWTVRMDEPVAFAELHSDQGIRMALLHVELPPQGALVQDLRVALSDQRSLRLALDFSELHPVIAVEYLDPALQPDETAQESHGATGAMRHAPTPADSGAPTTRGRSWWRRVRDAWPRPSPLVPVTLGILLLGATLWWAYGRSAAVSSAAALIEQAVVSEVGAVSATEAVHRTLAFHVRRADASSPSSTHRIDVWTRGDTKARAVRVFDRTGHLVAGRWLHDGRDEGIELGVFDDIWATDLSADAFRQRYMSIGPCTRSDDATTHTVVCERPAGTSWLASAVPTVHAAAPAAMVPSRATLVLRRADLHAVRMTLAVVVDGIEQIASLEEQVLTRVPVRDIPAGTFVAETHRRSGALPPVGTRPVRVPPAVTPSLEVRLLDAIDRLGAGGDLSVRRTAPNALSVAGLVSTASHRNAVLRAVSALNVTGAIAIDIQTFAEAAGQARSRTSRPTELRLLESAVGTAPIDAYLRSRIGSGEDPTRAIRELTPRVLALSERLKRHARALDAIIQRFDEQTVAALDPEGADAWQALLDRHAADALAAIDALDAALASYFDGDAGDERPSPTSLSSTSRRLANEATTIDDALAAAFTAADPVTAPARAASVVDVRQHLHRARLDARVIRGRIPR